ncbi:hypothetical protein J6590_066574 [Homalodisca vitripennis]|nr:hypothetical protein J6590_066574 [Homalodisca vitripennis]
MDVTFFTPSMEWCFENGIFQLCAWKIYKVRLFALSEATLYKQALTGLSCKHKETALPRTLAASLRDLEGLLCARPSSSLAASCTRPRFAQSPGVLRIISSVPVYSGRISLLHLIRVFSSKHIISAGMCRRDGPSVYAERQSVKYSAEITVESAVCDKNTIRCSWYSPGQKGNLPSQDQDQDEPEVSETRERPQESV